MWNYILLWFWLAFPCKSCLVMLKHLFMYLLAICMYSLEKMSIQIFYSFVIRLLVLLWLLNCMSSLYILDTRPFSDIWFAKIFSYFIHKLPFNFTDHFLCCTESFYPIFLLWSRHIDLLAKLKKEYTSIPKPHKRGLLTNS